MISQLCWSLWVSYVFWFLNSEFLSLTWCYYSVSSCCYYGSKKFILICLSMNFLILTTTYHSPKIFMQGIVYLSLSLLLLSISSLWLAQKYDPTRKNWIWVKYFLRPHGALLNSFNHTISSKSCHLITCTHNFGLLSYHLTISLPASKGHRAVADWHPRYNTKPFEVKSTVNIAIMIFTISCPTAQDNVSGLTF